MKSMMRAAGLSVLFMLTPASARAQQPRAEKPAPPRVVRVVTLGDSITKAVRPGVRPDETFSVLVERALRAEGVIVEVVNMGVGGERTDQALKRLETVIAQKPKAVTIMYGTNDSYVDKGAKATRIPVDAYRANLRKIVSSLLLQGIEPILMTEPRWADAAGPNGLGENPNVRLAPFMEACREVAAEMHVPLVDHFAHWSEARTKGQNLSDWTTDGCHPNPRGQRDLTEAMMPALRAAFRPAPPRVGFSTRLDTVLTHDDGAFLWYHPRAAAFPKAGAGQDPNVLITLQKHLKASDHYSGLSVLSSGDLGKTWSGPRPVAELDWVHEPGGVDVAVADVTPMYHAPSGKVLAVGAQVRYSAKGDQLEDRPLSNQTAYAVYDPKSDRWTRWRRAEMPAEPHFNFARSACAQGVVETDGSVLLPFYIGPSADRPYSTTVVRWAFDGETLAYRAHGDILSLNIERGLYEPSLARAGGRYFLTIRNDLKGYVTSGVDGLHYRPVKPWTFDDGEDLGSYNTQQHWLTRGDALFLVYTRRGANNDHIPRHRAPLFMAQVDPDRLHVLRATERVVVPERGGELGNFGATTVTDRESWVTVSEGVWNEDARRRGAKGATFVARMNWDAPADNATLPKTRSLLESGGPVRVVCLGDSVTGVYYHTGSRRAYADMLAIALKRAYPNAQTAVFNAGISGNTTRDALARIDRDVIARRPTLVTVMFGLNDMTRVPLADYRKNLAEITARCRAAGAEVLFCTPNNVITTPDRPSERLTEYCDAVRSEAKRLGVPVCDVYAGMEAFRAGDPLGWRLLMSDAIHPNMDGHKWVAEAIARSITGREVDLSAVPPPPALARVAGRISRGETVRVLAMPPADEWVAEAFKVEAPKARVEVTRWPTEGKSLPELEQDAANRVRPLAPDLVVLAVPRAATSMNLEGFIHGQAWVMNSSLSFGAGGWDCVAIHPSVFEPGGKGEPGRDDLVRRLVAAQDLQLIDRPAGESRPGRELFHQWIRTGLRP